MGSTVTIRNNYRPEIDGLRTIAVVPVILFHAGVDWAAGGYVGVDVFFVISGFLISQIIFKAMEAGTFSFRDFFERRARRILPALLLVIAATSVLSLLWMPPDKLRDFAQSVVATLLFSSNILFFLESGYWEQASELKPLLHTWSLAIEEQFYIVFPFVAWLLWRKGNLLVVILVVVFLVSFTASHLLAAVHPEATFYLALTRFWELILGILIAFYIHKGGTGPRGVLAEGSTILGMALIVLAVALYDDTTPFPSVYALAPTAGAGLVLLAGARSRVAAVVLASPVMVAIGLCSYSLYLWHFPLFALTRIRSLTEPGPEVLVPLAGVAGVLAFLSWKYVETPFRRRDVVGTRQLVVSLSASVFVLGVGFLVLSQEGASRAAFTFIHSTLNETSGQVIDQAQEVERVRTFDAQYEEDVGKTFDPSATLRVAIVGDSQSRNWMRAFRSRPDVFAPTMDLRWIFLDNACLALFSGDRRTPPGKGCVERKAAFIQSKLLLDADLIIVINRWSGANFVHIPHFLDTMRPLADKVVFVGSARFEDAAKIASRLGIAPGEADERQRWFYTLRDGRALKANRSLAEIVRSDGALYADEYDFYCDEVARRCRLMDGNGSMLLFDTDHVTVEGAHYIAPRIVALIREVMETRRATASPASR